MANINLLPWREWERERKQKEFLGQVVGILIVAVVVVLGIGQYLDTTIESQNGRNSYLDRKIKLLDEQIAEIRDLQRQRDDLLARMRVIQELQGNRPVIVRVFDQMVQTLAKGVHYNKAEMAGNTLTVAGVAESNNRISALMRNLDGSDWFTDPNLKGIKEDPENSDYGEQASTFDLSFQQINPNAPKEEDL
ncbi:MAG: pilus assembly protein PilN [Pseudomonadales bacterium]|nr:pilus assembly protein PilN [Pseudomonadales bacterium]